VRIVLAGGALAELGDAVAGFFGGAAVVTTTDGRVLAIAGDDDEVERTRSLDCFDRTGRLLVESEPVGPRDPDTPGSTRAFVKIVAGASDHGLLGAFSPQRPLTAADVHLLERAATVAALAITKEQAVSAVESKYRAEFLRDALAGRAGSPEEAIAHAQSLGWDIERPMVVVVAETDEDDAQTTRSAEEVRSLQHRFARAWTHAVTVRDPQSPVMGFSQEVVALFGVTDPEDTDRIMRTVNDVARVVRGDGGGGRRTFSTGVSRPITSVAELPQAYDEALNAVSVGRQMHGDGALTHFDGLGIFRLLALIPDSAHLRRFVEESLGELATDDSPENADLRQTLSILIDTNMNVAETARLLFFHYNTLRYRIVKLEKMLGPFTTDPQLRLTLALALKVHQMRGI
jgi:purine catabolism regulator